MPTGNKYELDEIKCPTCGREDFCTIHGVKTHHSIKHDCKLPNLICKNCSAKFYNRTPRKLCNKCLEDSYECPECDKIYSKIRRRNIHHKNKHGSSISTSTVVCSECSNKLMYNRDEKSKNCDCGNVINLEKDYLALNKKPESCPNCGDQFLNMGQHWKSSKCKYPDLSRKQKDLIKGIVMSDASVQFNVNNNNNIKIKMTNKEFLIWLKNELKEICHSKYPTLVEKGDKSKENAREYFGADNIDKNSNYKDKYHILTRSHPFNNIFDNWYNPEKRYPIDKLEITPTIAKMWYCGDGTLDTSKNRVSIACINESDRIESVADLIRDKGFRVNTTSEGRIRISSSDTADFLNWMGDPPPGFEYKWL